jgi:ABC-type uncharacterized transport system ATPase subunit
VYQHFSVIETFTIREQLQLAGWTSSTLPPLLGDRFHGHERIGDLSLGERQLVELAKALVHSPHVLLLDEPTSILTTDEVQQLFGILRALAAAGTAVILVTHKIAEATALCERVHVLRQGALVDTIAWSSTTDPRSVGNRILGAMFGDAAERAPAPEYERNGPRPAQTGPELFRAQLSGRSVVTSSENGAGVDIRLNEGEIAAGVDIRMNEGEIAAVVGVDRGGQRRLAEMLAGYRVADGTVTVRNRALTPGNAIAFRRHGVTYLTGDRMHEGTIPTLTVAENLILKHHRTARFSRRGWLRPGAIRMYAQAQLNHWRIANAVPETRAGTLSGGNVQRLLLARELEFRPAVLIAENPTQGLDARTQHLVWSAFRDLAGNGAGVLVFTTEIEEALAFADRIAVMYNGHLSAALPVTPDVRPNLERMVTSGW